MSRFRILRCPSGTCAEEGGPWHVIHPSGWDCGIYPTWNEAMAAFATELEAVRRQRALVMAVDAYRAARRAGR